MHGDLDYAYMFKPLVCEIYPMLEMQSICQCRDKTSHRGGICVCLSMYYPIYMYVYIYIYIYIYTCVNIHSVHIYIYIELYKYICKHAYTYMRM